MFDITKEKGGGKDSFSFLYFYMYMWHTAPFRSCVSTFTCDMQHLSFPTSVVLLSSPMPSTLPPQPSPSKQVSLTTKASRTTTAHHPPTLPRYIPTPPFFLVCITTPVFFKGVQGHLHCSGEEGCVWMGRIVAGGGGGGGCETGDEFVEDKGAGDEL